MNFVQIDNIAVNIEMIAEIEFRPDKQQVFLWATKAPAVVFEGEDYARFLDWWENKAEVCQA